MRHTVLSRHLPIPLYRATPDGQEADNDDHVAKYAVISRSPITAHRLSSSLCISVPLTYGYYPVNTDKRPTFLIGLTLSFVWVTLMGVVLGAGVISNPAFATAYNTSSGALILGGFGEFCGVVVALGIISNNIPGTYTTAPRYQVLGRFGKAIPDDLWVCVVVAMYFVCAIADRNDLFNIFENFLALMGYWLLIFVSIVLEEQLVFE